MCHWTRNSPWPYDQINVDDNNPSTFYYENTPAWAEVYVGQWGSFYWGSSSAPIRFDTRAVGIDWMCGNLSYWAYYAGVQLAYHPSYGFQEWAFSPGD